MKMTLRIFLRSAGDTGSLAIVSLTVHNFGQSLLYHGERSMELKERH